VNLSNCESVKGVFFKIMGFAGKRFPFSPPHPLPAASISVAFAPTFVPSKCEKRVERAENPTETLATQTIAKSNRSRFLIPFAKKRVKINGMNFYKFGQVNVSIYIIDMCIKSKIQSLV